jgi:hypothetical protein
MAGLLQAVDITGQAVTLTKEDTVSLLNEAIKRYGSTQGSPIPLLEDAFTKDPDFLFVQLFIACILCSDTVVTTYPRKADDPKVQRVLKLLDDEEKLQKYTWREQQYAKAVKIGSTGNLPGFADALCVILVEHPTDIVALRMVLGLSITIGCYELLRDTVARTLPFWKEDNPLYVQVLTYYAFALEETNFRDEAADLSYKCLRREPKSPWAHHTLTHVVEETRDPQEGVDLLVRTRGDWEDTGLGHHILWHLTLHYLDMGANEKALQEFDNVMQHSLCDGNIYAVIDSASLLWRLELNNCNPGEERWQKLVKFLEELPDSRGFFFFDLHKMLSFAHGKVTESAARTALAEQLLRSAREYADAAEGYLKNTYQIGAPILEGLLAFGKGEYEEVLQQILPLRYKLVNVGGSWAQRQVVLLTALKAAREGKNVNLALALAAEMKALKPKCNTMKKVFDELLAIQNGTEKP